MKKIRIPLVAFCIIFSFSLTASATSNSKNTNLNPSDVKKVASVITNTKSKNVNSTSITTKTIKTKKTIVKVNSKTQVIPVSQISQFSRGTSSLYLSKPQEHVETVKEQKPKNVIDTNIVFTDNPISKDTKTNLTEKRPSSQIKLDTTYVDASTPNDSLVKNDTLQKPINKSASDDIITPPNDIIDYAKTFLGVPYVTAGNGNNDDRPYGFDCSGFTKYVFAHFNINIQRRARDQAKEGQAVDLSDLQPGDLVFFGDPIKYVETPIQHVGIYAGNDYYIHSPHSGAFVSLAKFSSRKDFYCARRVTK